MMLSATDENGGKWLIDVGALRAYPALPGGFSEDPEKLKTDAVAGGELSAKAKVFLLENKEFLREAGKNDDEFFEDEIFLWTSTLEVFGKLAGFVVEVVAESHRFREKFIQLESRVAFLEKRLGSLLDDGR